MAGNNKSDNPVFLSLGSVSQIDELLAIPHDQIACLDVETTGLDPQKDEILQVSICNGSGRMLLNSYVHPATRKRWPNAQKVNHITWSMVKDAPTLLELRDAIERILGNCQLLIGYNIGRFDLTFLRAGQVSVPPVRIYDLIYDCSVVHGSWNDYYENYSFVSLKNATRIYGIKYDAHNSAEDVRATTKLFFAFLQSKALFIKVEQQERILAEVEAKRAAQRQAEAVRSTPASEKPGYKSLRGTASTGASKARIAIAVFFFICAFTNYAIRETEKPPIVALYMAIALILLFWPKIRATFERRIGNGESDSPKLKDQETQEEVTSIQRPEAQEVQEADELRRAKAIQEEMSDELMRSQQELESTKRELEKARRDVQPYHEELEAERREARRSTKPIRRPAPVPTRTKRSVITGVRIPVDEDNNQAAEALQSTRELGAPVRRSEPFPLGVEGLVPLRTFFSGSTTTCWVFPEEMQHLTFPAIDLINGVIHEASDILEEELEYVNRLWFNPDMKPKSSDDDGSWWSFTRVEYSPITKEGEDNPSPVILRFASDSRVSVPFCHRGFIEYSRDGDPETLEVLVIAGTRRHYIRATEKKYVLVVKEIKVYDELLGDSTAYRV